MGFTYKKQTPPWLDRQYHANHKISVPTGGHITFYCANNWERPKKDVWDNDNSDGLIKGFCSHKGEVSVAMTPSSKSCSWLWHINENTSQLFSLFKAGRNAVQSALSESQTLQLFWELNWCPRTQTTFGTQNCGKAKASLMSVKTQVLWLIISRETWRSNISVCPMEHTKHQRRITNGQGVLNHQ